MMAEVRKLSCFRDEFIAIPTATKMPDILTKRAEFTAWAKELRQRAKLYGISKAWICPGKCGNCTPTGHACGSRKFNGIPVVIGIH